MPDSTIRYIKSILPNASPISRYGSSQAFGAIGYSRRQHPKLHVIHNNLCHTVIIDENGQIINDYDRKGNIMITHLHNNSIPILNTMLYDRACYIKGPHNKPMLKLFGRVDGLLILNSQKIDIYPLLEAGAKILNNSGIQINGISQLIKNGYTDIEFKFESFNISKPEYIKDKILNTFRKNIITEIARLASKSNLPANRAIENLNINCELLPNMTIQRYGERNKVKVFMDMTGN